MTTTYPDREHIARLLRPSSVAVVGASDKPGALVASVLGNLLRNGFAGTIYPVNPNRDRIGDLACLPSVDALPEGVDVAVLAIPQAFVLDTVRGLAARKVGAAIIFSAGFAEGGPEGLAQQAEIARIGRESGMVIEGPNCLGLVNHVNNAALTFVETLVTPPSAPALAVVSQSGAMAAVLCTTMLARQVPVSYSVSTGNEAASGVEHYIDWLVEDPHTQVVAMIVEQFRNPQAFLAAARAIHQAGKRIVLLHPGKSSAARESAATHTGAMAGDHQLMRAKVERAGVIFAETLEELGDISEILLRSPALTAREVAVLGESGAFKALTLDLAEELGLPLAPLHDEDSPALRAALPVFVPVSNPLDITAQGLSQPSIYTETLKALLSDDRIGAVIAGIIQGDPVTAKIKVPAILPALEGATKPVIFAGLDEGAEIPAQYIKDLRAAGATYFPSTERALRAVTRIGLAATRDLADHTPAPFAIPALEDEAGVIPEYRSKALLAPLGLAFPRGGFAASAEDAVKAAQAAGYPVAMKAQAAALSHKSDAGGVILNLPDDAAVRTAWDTIHANVAAYDAGIVLDGVLIETMGARGLEMIVGAKNDPDWGPVVLAGFGGVTAEILKDVALITPDLGEEQIVAALMGLKNAPLLSGWRGAPALDVRALARLIRQVAAVLVANPRLLELDLNPVILRREGEGLLALDALMLIG